MNRFHRRNRRNPAGIGTIDDETTAAVRHPHVRDRDRGADADGHLEAGTTDRAGGAADRRRRPVRKAADAWLTLRSEGRDAGVLPVRRLVTVLQDAARGA